MDETTPGIILRTRPITETSLIVNWLTPEHGRISTIARGALRPKSSVRGKLDLFHEATLSFARSRKGDLHSLREVQLNQTHPALRRDWAKLQLASYAVRLMELTLERETPVPEFHQLLHDLLTILDQTPSQPSLLLWFEVRFLDLNGLSIESAAAQAHPEVRRVLESLVSRTGNPPPPEPALRRAAAFIQGFMAHHLERLPEGRVDVLASAWNLPCPTRAKALNHDA